MQKRGAALRRAQDAAPAAPTERPPLPAFTPVPRKYRHEGWSFDKLRMSGPKRQRALIEALADCGSVTRAAARVDIGPKDEAANCYTLRRAPRGGGEPMASANIGTIRRSRCGDRKPRRTVAFAPAKCTVRLAQNPNNPLEILA